MDTLMTKKYSDKELKYIALQRLINFNWELPVSEADVDAVHASMPERHENEPVDGWLRRAIADNKGDNVIPMPAPKPRPIPYSTSYITLRAAADGKRILKRVLESDDNKFRLTIEQEGNQIYIKAEALGMAIEDYANRQLEITCSALIDIYSIMIDLDMMAEGEVAVLDDPHSQQLLLSQDTRIIINVL